MTEYWWLVAIPVLIVALAPSMSSAASEWRTARAAGNGMSSADSSPDLAADFLWIGIMLTAFLLLFQLRS